ncbi:MULTISPECIES: very short patch repair endonuclease [unclassified Xanthobacter]|uniref:very short patch repair endonuclease n=1 Tax=unclassified Xanthobacter TaxID=2623496 RepID=UPI001EDFA0C6|nr:MULTISPECIES: DNA mismatch endonuclease Vsr [unclassified Xanthobacter]
MVDKLTPDQRRLNMSRVRAKDTWPEMTVRRLLHHAGFRFRLHRRDLPGRPDIILPRYRTAIFVHGCFWHGHGCSLFRMPATRTDFWSSKIAGNRYRDEAAVTGLRAAGWRSLWVWECALRGKHRLTPMELSERMAAFIQGDAGFEEVGETGSRHEDQHITADGH